MQESVALKSKVEPGVDRKSQPVKNLVKNDFMTASLDKDSVKQKGKDVRKDPPKSQLKATAQVQSKKKAVKKNLKNLLSKKQGSESTAYSLDDFLSGL